MQGWVPSWPRWPTACRWWRCRSTASSPTTPAPSSAWAPASPSLPTRRSRTSARLRPTSSAAPRPRGSPSTLSPRSPGSCLSTRPGRDQARPDPTSRSCHGSAVVGGRHQPGLRQCGQSRVWSRSRAQTSAGGANGTPRPAHTSCAWRTSSSAPRGGEVGRPPDLDPWASPDHGAGVGRRWPPRRPTGRGRRCRAPRRGPPGRASTPHACSSPHQSG